jgi:prepilin-type N-terminal cleavage/methylation domain-containing protein/prepilin-type processing-associated H-X9-DG protein
MTRWKHQAASPHAGFSLMELIVTIAIVVVLTAVAVPTVRIIRANGHKKETLAILKALAAAAQTYSADHNDELPREDAKGSDSWKAMGAPENELAWYNALPKLLQKQPASAFEATPREFYTRANALFIPGAPYPQTEHRLHRPLFAVAINSKLQRRDEQGGKPPVKRSEIQQPTRTVLFLEKGLAKENRLPSQSRQDFDGSPKGSGKSLPPRYNGKGVIAFVDGNVAAVDPRDLLTESNQLHFPPIDVIWTRSPEEDPNK